MKYKIGEVAKLTNLSLSTLRYYDKEGMFKNLKKNENGNRLFDDEELLTLKWIDCLKKTGMSLKDIKQYLNLIEYGDDTLEDRLQLFYDREQAVKNQLKELEETLKMIEIKKWWYSESLKHGSENYIKSKDINDYPPTIYNLFIEVFGTDFYD